MIWRPTPKDIERFTCGDCHYLARAIHRLTGWSMASFDAYGGPDYHAFTLTPDGRALDVEGVRTIKEMQKRWSMHLPVAPFDWNDGLSLFGSPAFGSYSVDRARIIAPRLVAQYLTSANGPATLRS